MTNTRESEQHSTSHAQRTDAKITIIGGGSPYCAGLMKSFAHEAQAFQGCTMVVYQFVGQKTMHDIVLLSQLQPQFDHDFGFYPAQTL